MPAPACGNVVIDPGELCDDGNADDTDSCTHDCLFTPKELVLGAPTMGPSHGGGGGFDFADDCPQGSVLRGVRVYPEVGPNNWVAGLQFHCGYPKLSGLAIVVSPGPDLPLWNADEIAPDEAQDLLCPPDQVIVATFGSSGSVIDNLGIRCAPLQLMPAADGYHIVPGQTGDLGPHGGGNAPNFDDPCAGAMRGAHVNLGSWVNAFAARCSTLTVE